MSTGADSTTTTTTTTTRRRRNAGRWQSARERLAGETYLTTGCPKLDLALNGGISRRGVTQIYGAAGTGKTQYALQLCLAVQIPEEYGGSRAGAAYVCTESAFPTRRLRQLLERSELVVKYGASADGIFVEHASTIEALESCLSGGLARLRASRKIGLLVIDSIAAPYRAEYEESRLKERAGSLRRVAGLLRRLSRSGDLAVVCVNQISAAMDVHDGASDSEDLPTLGATWSSLVTNCYRLERKRQHRAAAAAAAATRSLRVIACPYLPTKVIPFEIESSGLGGL